MEYARAAAKHKFNDAAWQAITNASCVDTALALGLNFSEEKSDRKSLHVPGYGGLFVFRDGKGFYNHSDETSGNAPKLVQYVIGCKYGESLEWINDNVLGHHFQHETVNYEQKAEKEKVEFILPERTRPARIYWYLIQQRGIERSIVAKMIEQDRVFQEAERGNVCFVGYDKEGTARYCSKRGTSQAQWRGEVDGSDKQYGFTMPGTSSTLKVFEAPIDAMSHASLAMLNGSDWRNDPRLALGGLSSKALDRYLDDHPNINSLWLCMDNDEQGQKAAQKFAEKYGSRYDVKIKPPHLKDFNQDLQCVRSIVEHTDSDVKSAIRLLYKSIGDPMEQIRASETDKAQENEQERG